MIIDWVSAVIQPETHLPAVFVFYIQNFEENLSGDRLSILPVHFTAFVDACEWALTQTFLLKNV